MRFLRVEQRAGEAVAQSWFGFGKLGGRQPPMPPGHAGEAIELGAVAMQRDDERAVGLGAGIGLLPQRDAASAELADDGLGAFLLAAWREHGAGIRTASLGEGFCRALVQRHGVTAPGEQERLP